MKLDDCTRDITIVMTDPERAYCVGDVPNVNMLRYQVVQSRYFLMLHDMEKSQGN
jgi:hypothetical protein